MDKIRVYVCTGCGIGECLDAERLAKVAAEEQGLPVQVHPPLCVPEGVQFLRQDIEADGGTEGVVIAACSERVNWDVFSTESLKVKGVERVNIREQVAWSKPPNEEETQMLAEDYVRMGIARARNTVPPEAKVEPVERALLVMGGGISGLTAALEAAEAGSEVTLVEKRDTLGGWLTRFYKMFPSESPYRDLGEPTVDAAIKAVQEHPRIQVMTSSHVERTSGQPGSFEVTVRRDGDTVSLRAGSVVLATGWEPYDASVLEYLGLGKYANVVSSVTVEELAKAGPIVRPADGRVVGRVAFVQRIGVRGEGDFTYGSAVGDLVALKQAMYFRERNPEAQVYIIYEDMVTPGQYEIFYSRVQEEPGVFFTRGQVTRIAEGSDGSLVLEASHTLLGESIQLAVDMVVLATGMAPSTKGAEALNLEYKQGPELPGLKYGFPDSNYICFPYETRRTGLYAAGCVRGSMDVQSSVEDATGAALKAVQSLELIARGEAVHPRVGDLSLPYTRLQGCTQCGRCSEECPFGAIEVDEQRNPRLNPSRCRRCGICMGACPVQVISFENYSVTQLTSVVRAIQFPEDFEKLRILAFACENDAYPAFDMAGINRLVYDASVRVVPVRCLGSLNMAVVNDAVSGGIDGILLLGCKSGDNYQCHFMQGSELAEQRLANVQETLTRQMLEPERIRPVELEISEYDKIPAMVNEFVEQLKGFGPNPYKGF